MQPTPLRLSQTLRTAFIRARPTRSCPAPARNFSYRQAFLHRPQICTHNLLGFLRGASFYSTEKQSSAPTEHENSPSPPPETEPPSKPSSQHPESSSSSAFPSTHESRRSPLSLRLTHTLDHLQTLLLTSSRRLNDLTGYTSIETLKSEITTLESAVQAARSSLSSARTAYTSAVTTRSTSQREVNSLLQRKHAWSASDLERFTQLYRSDHANEVEEARAQEELAKREREVEELQDRLRMGILKRYHEEQVWSDKIRRMSTWGTWGLMAVNVLLFLVLQVVVEPWRRRRLVRGFKEEVRGLVEDGRGRGAQQQQQQQLPLLAEAIATGDGVNHESKASEGSPETETATQTSTPTSTLTPTTSTIESLQDEPTPLTDISTQPPQPPPPLSSTDLSTEPPISPKGPITTLRSTYTSYRASLASLFSDRAVTLTQRDVTARTLEGFAGGAALVGVLVVVLRPR
ncbi:MAG: hypothetical protein Q9160_000607 [Pyrenula sp. 1 TL-2023]